MKTHRELRDQPLHIVVSAEVTFPPEANKHWVQICEELRGLVEQAIDNGIDRMADLTMPTYTNVRVHTED